MKLNGKEYKVPEIKSFKDLVTLEAQGIKIMALVSRSFYNPANLATSLVTGLSFYTGLPFEEALNEVSEMIDNGGSMEDLMNSLLEDVKEMENIGAVEGFSKGAKAPQDYKKAVKKAVAEV